MPKLETVMIETKNGPVVINKSDYDEKEHKLHKPTKAEKEATEPEPVVNPVLPSEVPPVPGTAPITSAPVYGVVTEGKGKAARSFVVDTASGERVTNMHGIDAEGYATDGDAWQAVIALQGNATTS